MTARALMRLTMIVTVAAIVVVVFVHGMQRFVQTSARPDCVAK